MEQWRDSVMEPSVDPAHRSRGGPMTALRATGRGLRDFYDHLFRYIFASAGWWIAALTVVFIPPATAVLFELTDPRRQRFDDHLSFGETIRSVFTWFVKSWKLAVISILPCALLAINIWYYARNEGPGRSLGLVWITLFLIWIVASAGAYSGMVLFGDTPLDAMRAGLGIFVQRVVQSLFFALLILVVTTISLFFVIPAIFMLPATLAAIANRYALAVWAVKIADPNAPTEARQAEVKRTPGWRRRLSGR